MKNIGLLFGSFNPPHKGHVTLGDLVKEKVDEVWYVPAAQNPAKKEKPVDIDIRIEMLQSLGLIVSEIEKELGEGPHYTYDVMKALQERYPDCSFSVVCGNDIDPSRWRNGKKLVKEFGVIRVPRIPSFSSTEVRAGNLELCPPEVVEIIKRDNLYSL